MEFLSLKWNNHQNIFCHQISELRNKEIFTDATLACNGKLYNVHRFVLSICSDYFNTIFKQTISKSPIIIIKDIHSKYIEYLLDYMYKGEINVCQTELSSLIVAAETLQIKGLAISDECEEVPSNKKDCISKNHETKNTKITNKNIDKNSLEEKVNLNSHSPNKFKDNINNEKVDLSENESLTNIKVETNKTLNKIKIEATESTNELENIYSEPLIKNNNAEDINFTKDIDLKNCDKQLPIIENASKFEQNKADEDNIMDFNSLLSSNDVSNEEFSNLEYNRNELSYLANDSPFDIFNQRESIFRQNDLEDGQIFKKNRKKYACSFCDKVFNYRTNQLGHERTHTGEKPFHCLYCPLKTALKGNLKHHILKIHQIEWKNIRHLISPRKFGAHVNKRLI